MQAGLDTRVGRAGRTWVALQLGSGHCSEASSTGPLQVLTFCAVQVPTGWQRQGIVMLAWLGTPPIQPADPSPRISVLPATAPAVRFASCRLVSWCVLSMSGWRCTHDSRHTHKQRPDMVMLAQLGMPPIRPFPRTSVMRQPPRHKPQIHPLVWLKLWLAASAPNSNICTCFCTTAGHLRKCKAARRGYKNAEKLVASRHGRLMRRTACTQIPPKSGQEGNDLG